MSADSDEQPAEEMETLLRTASSLADEEQWEEAFGLLLERVDEFGNDPAYLCWLAVSAREAGAENQAYDFFRRCLQQQPEDSVILATAGIGLSAFDDPEAESALRLAALSAPGMAEVRLMYGTYLAREGLLELALSELEAARSLAPDNPAVQAELGIAYLLAGRSGDGLAALEDSLSGDSENSWLRSLYGLALLEGGRSEEAAEELYRASLERLEDGEVQLLCALACATQEWDSEAWSALARAEAASLNGSLLQEAEEHIEAGFEAADAFLREEVAPSLFRERLLQRV